jgi:hypothetical protein
MLNDCRVDTTRLCSRDLSYAQCETRVPRLMRNGLRSPKYEHDPSKASINMLLRLARFAS